jgi:hypothetical protein
MKIGKLKKDNRYETRNDRTLGIQTFGEKNDYPQQVTEIVGASGTGMSCIDVFSKFISGQGFNDPAFFNQVINRQGQTNDALLNLIAHDFAMFNGFAIHINYNANYKITQLQFVPFETVRLRALDEAGNYNAVSLHWDWGRRMTQLKKWSKDDIVVIDIFNPEPKTIDEQVSKAGGWNTYKGQVYYYSGSRANNYPLPKFDAVLTDMSTEEGIANISYRNARHNFLMSGMLVDILEKDESEEQANETEKNLLEFQGDTEAGNLIYSSVKSKEDIPHFIKFSGQNYDKEYTVTREKVKNDIGRSFNQPPILRAEDVGSNFGADALRNAYDYYNSVAEVERLQIERVFAQLFKHWSGAQFNDLSILPLEYISSKKEISNIPAEVLSTLTANEKRALLGYDELQDSDNNQSILAEKLGVGGTQSLISIVSDPEMTGEQKRALLKLLFSFSDEETISIIPET